VHVLFSRDDTFGISCGVLGDLHFKTRKLLNRPQTLGSFSNYHKLDRKHKRHKLRIL
jgi:hypothetical protein